MHTCFQVLALIPACFMQENLCFMLHDNASDSGLAKTEKLKLNVL